MSTQKTGSPSKKQLRSDIATKLDNAIGHMAQSADKKFKKLIKKAAKILADGLHHKPKKAPAKKKVAAPAKPAVKKAAVKKAAPKKAAKKK